LGRENEQVAPDVDLYKFTAFAGCGEFAEIRQAG
jgi:hypothetical protein